MYNRFHHLKTESLKLNTLEYFIDFLSYKTQRKKENFKYSIIIISINCSKYINRGESKFSRKMIFSATISKTIINIVKNLPINEFNK